MKRTFLSACFIPTPILHVEAQIAKDSLVAFYPFRGTANYSGSNHYSGKVMGTTLTTDRFGRKENAYAFNGIDQYIEVSDQDAFSIANTGKLSISAWMRCDTRDFPRSEGGYVHWMGKGLPK